ncbi:MAG: hypothetical protein RR651_07090, partial [Lysinibacillus sp.]
MKITKNNKNSSTSPYFVCTTIFNPLHNFTVQGNDCNYTIKIFILFATVQWIEALIVDLIFIYRVLKVWNVNTKLDKNYKVSCLNS